MAIIKITVTPYGPPIVTATFPEDRLPSMQFNTGDFVADWFLAISHCIDAITSNKVDNPWLSTQTRDFDNSDAFHDYLMAFLVPIKDGWDLRYKPPAHGLSAKVYVPRDKPMTYSDLLDYCNKFIKHPQSN